MRLSEWEAKKILRAVGIPIPASRLITTVEHVPEAAAALPPPVFLKAQVPATRRMRAGGVVRVETIEEAHREVRRLLGSRVHGFPVETLLWEEAVPVVEELWCAVTYEAAAESPVILLSRAGGNRVEERALAGQSGLVRHLFSPLRPVESQRLEEITAALGLAGRVTREIAAIVGRMVEMFLRCDATLLEINPLALTEDGKCLALDAHLEIDDDALFRHPELQSEYGVAPREGTGRPATEFERQAAVIDAQDHRGVAGRVIEFDGDLGLLIGGGGASLTIFDAIRRRGGRPANYCEIGGNPTVRKVADLTRLILSRQGVRRLAVIMNVVSNTRADLVARGVITGVIEAGRVPAETITIFRVPGAWEEEGAKILARYGVRCADRTVSLDEAARLAAGTRDSS